MAFVRAVATVGSWTMASRVLGFVRDILIARFLGTGPVADAFFVAFKFPNFFRRLFAEGAFNAAFVPQFARQLQADGPDAARYFAEQVLAVMLAVLLPLTIVAQVAMPALMVVLAPGFLDTPATFALAVELARITFPYLMFMTLLAIYAGVLNSLNKFASAAAAPIVLNLVLITALVLFRNTTPTVGHTLAWGVALAGVLQLLVVAIAAARNGMDLRLRVPHLTPGVKKTLRLMAPGAIGAGVVQFNLVIDTLLASTLPTGSISYLYFADRVSQLPLGVIGVAIGIALLPLLSRQIRAGDDTAAMASQNRAIELALLMTVPAALALIVIPEPIVVILFQRGAFSPTASTATAAALAAFALGLPAYVLIKTLTPGFFAREDTATPVKIAAVAVALNIVVAVTLMQFIAHVGIALATATSAWVNTALLATMLHRRGHLHFDVRLRRRAPRILAAAVVMALVLWRAAIFVEPLMADPGFLAVAALGALIALGGATYAIAAWLLGAVSLADLRQATRRS